VRGLKSFLLLLIIAGGLGWFAYRDYHREPGSDLPKKDKVFTVDAEKIDEVRITAEGGERTTLKKTGTEWQMVEPIQTRPEGPEVSAVTTNLSTLEMQSVVDENAPDLKEYGLDPARIEVTFKAGNEERTLRIGQKTPPGSDLYARIGDEKKVFLIPSYVESTFNKKPFDLRDKTVLHIERDKVDGLELTNATGTMRFQRVSGEWHLVEPVKARADFNAVEGLVGRLAGMEMKSIQPASAVDAKKTGLDKPIVTARVMAGSSQAVLTIGAEAAEGAYYARDASRPDLLTVDPAPLDDFKKDAGEFRQKDLFDARSFNSSRLEIARGGQTVVFEKVKSKDKDGKDEEKWRQTSPQARDVDQPKVEALLNAITGSRAASFVPANAKPQAGTPEMTIAIAYDDPQKEDRVSFTRAGADVHATRAGDASAAKVDAATLDGIVKALEALK
jgi:hypothetical protein